MSQSKLLSKELMENLSGILESGELSDCSFLVGPESGQQLIASYKLILATASPVFKAMFYGSLAEKNSPITMPDVLPAHFKVFLNYIYTSEMNKCSLEEASGVYYCAKKFLMPHLQQLCSDLFLSQIDSSNACLVYEEHEEYARLFEDNKALDKAKEIMTEGTKLVLSDPSFEKIKFSTLLHIFSLDMLCIDSEMDLVDAAVRYYKSRGKENIITSARGKLAIQNEADDKTELSIQSIIDKIRFLTVTPKRYAECQARELLMSESEDRAVLLNISSENTNVPYPCRLCPSRESRVQKNMSKTFSLTIRDIRNFNCKVYSSHHYVCDSSWRILAWLGLFPFDDESKEKYLSVYLICFPSTKSLNWEIKFRCEMTLLSQTSYSQTCSRTITVSLTTATGWHFSHFTTWKQVLNPSNGYMKNGAITIRACMKVLKYSFEIS